MQETRHINGCPAVVRRGRHRKQRGGDLRHYGSVDKDIAWRNVLFVVCASLNNTRQGIGLQSQVGPGQINTRQGIGLQRQVEPGQISGHYVAAKDDLGTGDGCGRGEGLGTSDESLQRPAFGPLLNGLQCLNHLRSQARDGRGGIGTSSARQAGSTAKAHSSYSIPLRIAAVHPRHECVH